MRKSLYVVKLMLFLVAFMITGKNYLCGDMSSLFDDNIAIINVSKVNNKSIFIKTSRIKYSNDNPYVKGGWWGTDSWLEKTTHGWRLKNVQKPKYLLNTIQVIIQNNEIIIPLSAYCDLAEPYKILLKSNEKGFVLSIFGGSASTSYQADLIFEKNRFVSRKVFSAEFPSKCWEKTVYQFNLNDMM